MRQGVWKWGRFVGSAAVLAVLIWRLGTGPFVDGIRTVDGGALAAAAALGAATTVCCAWRWKIVASALGAELSLPAAVAAYYRSLFLNVTLPGGVVGDAHRGVSHGLRAVVYERLAGQAVQVVMTVVVLLVLPSPVQSAMPLVAPVALVAVIGIVLVGRSWPWRAWPGIVVASALVVAGHAATFLIAARTAGVDAPLSRILPLAFLVMAVMALPSVGGWGAREGGAAWAFAAAGLGAAQGIATTVVYGVIVLVACLPGGAVLVFSWARRTPAEMPLSKGAAHA